MKFIHVLVIVIISAAVAWSVAHFTPSVGTAPAARETAYQRVMRTGTIRCGYFLAPRLLERDLNTKQMSGISADLMEAVGRHLSLKIEWTEEAGLGSLLEGLRTSRYDAVCFTMAQTPGRARAAESTSPVIFYPYFLYARADDKRFDNNYDRINDPAVKVAILEGEMSQTVKNESFPEAATLSLPELTDISQIMVQVAMGKADVAMAEPSTAAQFTSHNPGKIRRVEGPVLRIQPGGLNVAVGEHELRNMFETTLLYMQVNGELERIFSKYAQMPDEFFQAAQPWGASVPPKKQ